MDMHKRNMHVKVFDLKSILESGQVFGWKKKDDFWIGEINRNLVMIKQKDSKLMYEIIYKRPKIDFKAVDKEIKRYFTLDIPISKIKAQYKELSKDKILKKAINEFYGLRILRQEPWYCMATFVCSSFSNIPKIEKNIENIKKMHGKKIKNKFGEFYLFPKINELKRATKDELRKCGLGFRDKYLHQISQNLDYSELDRINKMKYEKAKKLLVKLPGIGEKVADCILLFGYEMGESFPIDVWIKKIIIKFYKKEIEKFMLEKYSGKKRINYRIIQEFARHKWGKNAGLAQQFLYMYARKHRLKV